MAYWLKKQVCAVLCRMLSSSQFQLGKAVGFNVMMCIYDMHVFI